MTGLAGINLGIFTMKHDLQRLMRIMTGQTICIHLALDMRLMAIKTGGDQAMLGMTSGTALLGMLAGELGQHATGTGMAIRALGLEVVGQGHIARGMRIGVTLQAVGELRAMGWGQVAIQTLGHQVGIVSLGRVVCVELGVAVLTGKLMPAPIFLQIIKLTGMTLTTLGWRQWRRSFLVQLRSLWDLYHIRGHGRCGHDGHTEQSRQSPTNNDHLFHECLL